MTPQPPPPPRSPESTTEGTLEAMKTILDNAPDSLTAPQPRSPEEIARELCIAFVSGGNPNYELEDAIVKELRFKQDEIDKLRELRAMDQRSCEYAIARAEKAEEALRKASLQR